MSICYIYYALSYVYFIILKCLNYTTEGKENSQLDIIYIFTEISGRKKIFLGRKKRKL